MKLIVSIDEATFPIFDEGTQTGDALENTRFNSCRFCRQGRGTFRATDSVTGEVFYLCAAHRAAYDEATDTAVIPPPEEGA